MNSQLILSIGREFGSGGHEIAQKLADIYGLPLYDHNLLDEMASAGSLNSQDLKKFDEVKRNKLLSRTVRGLNNSPEQNVAFLQFEYLKKKADAGESFVIVGRCAETVLKENKGLISIFILGDMEHKIERIMEIYHLSETKAEKLALEKDMKRKRYHNSYCGGKWGDSRNYDISINSSRLPMEETIRILSQYIDARRS
ncbi:MAG: cytidylate kinase-like family protein [Lachnospiraceae bacterium]|nr:cytidylate kinase-like family protein [Lachnospiraceae bacterium]